MQSKQKKQDEQRDAVGLGGQGDHARAARSQQAAVGQYLHARVRVYACE
jgi:hypothetical protein